MSPSAANEIAAWEHSEPGTGPMPVYGDAAQDKAIKNGWRVESWPAAYPGYEDPFFTPVSFSTELPYEAE